MAVRALWALIPVLAGASQAAPSQPPALACRVSHYRVTPVPLVPVAINAVGQVAGTTAQHRAAVWSQAGGLRELPLPAGFVHSEAVSINSQGHVAAMAFDAGFTRHQAYVVAGDVVTPLPGEAARARHISETDRVSGEAQAPGKTATQPALWVNAKMQLIGTCCGGSLMRSDPAGKAIGVVYDDQGRYQAVRWSEVAGIERIDPQARFSAAVAANDRGQVVLETFPGVRLYGDGQPQALKLAPRAPSHPHALNDCGVIVGSFGPFTDAERAFAWDEATGFQDLNALIPEVSGWTLESATGINGRGEIVGRGDNGGADDTGFLLVPVPP